MRGNRMAFPAAFVLECQMVEAHSSLANDHEQSSQNWTGVHLEKAMSPEAYVYVSVRSRAPPCRCYTDGRP